MQNILIIAPNEKGGSAAYIVPALKESGYAVAVTSLEGNSTVDFLCAAFAGRPPDVLIADLSKVTDCLPLRHTRKLLHQTWSEDLPAPVCLALLESRHLTLPDWRALIDDFLL